MMASESSLRLKRFEADEKARKVEDLEYMIHDFEQMASDLTRQIVAEEERTGIKDVTHFSYSTFAKSAMQRRDNLLASVEELREKLAAAQSERDEARDQLDKASTVGEGREEKRDSRLAVSHSQNSHSVHR